MAKPSKKQAQAYRMKLTAWFGLSIFAIGLIAQLVAMNISFAVVSREWGATPQLLVGFGVSLLAGILPPAVAYFVGEKLVKPRSKYEHYYNGVLFAFLSIWVSAIVGALMFSFVPVPVGLIIPIEYLQYTPQLFALLTVLLLAYLYGKKYKHVALHDFWLYQVLLVGCMAVMFIFGAAAFIISTQGQLVELTAMAVIGLLISLGMVVVPYVFSREPHTLTRLTFSCIAGSIGIWSLAAVSFMPFYYYGLEWLQVIVPSVVGLAAWFVYIYLLYRHNA